MQRWGEGERRGLSEQRGDLPMLCPCQSAQFGQPSVGMVGFGLLTCWRVWVEIGFRCVVMWEGCDGLLRSLSQVVRGVKERLGAGETSKRPV